MKKVISIFMAVILIFSMCTISVVPVHATSQIDNIVSIARSKIGYYSRPNEFTYWFGKVGNTYSYPWCATFVSWCANQAGIPTSVIPKHCGCTAGMEWFKNNGRWEYSSYYGGDYTPKAGDIVYYTNSNNIWVSDHVGIVTGINGEYLTVVEGNTENNQVKEYTTNNKRRLNSGYVIGYGIPAYDSPVCSCSDSYAGGYTVTTSSLPLTMRSGHGTGYSSITSIPKGEQVYVSKSDGIWAHVEWSGYNGYCSMQYLTRIEDKPTPTGYNISVSPNSFYDNEVSTVTITPYDDNITNYKLHFITPDGRYTSPDLGNKNYLNFVCRGVYGTWKVYAEITNEYGTFCGSEDNGCVSFEIKEVNLGVPVDLGTDFYARIDCAATDKVLTHDPSWSEYTNVYMGDWTITDNQFFKFTRQSDGSYIISSKQNNNYCLDVYNNDFHSGTNVGMYPANGSNAQKWNIYSAGNGYYYFRPFDYNSAMLDVEGASTESGANVQLYTYNATEAQKFSIVKVTDTEKPTATISSSSDISATQTVTLSFYDNRSIIGYYWGTNSTYDKNKYVMDISHTVTQSISEPGTYYVTVKDTSGNLSDTLSISFYETTLDSNGGSLSTKSILTESGKTITLPKPVRDGYVFLGWGTSSNSVSGVQTLTVTSNKTYYAVWLEVDLEEPTSTTTATEPKVDKTESTEIPTTSGFVDSKTYIVVFNDGFGKTLSTQIVKHGASATEPSITLKESYVFDGWDLDFSNVTTNMIVTAQWKIKSPVDFDAEAYVGEFFEIELSSPVQQSFNVTCRKDVSFSANVSPNGWAYYDKLYYLYKCDFIVFEPGDYVFDIIGTDDHNIYSYEVRVNAKSEIEPSTNIVESSTEITESTSDVITSTSAMNPTFPIVTEPSEGKGVLGDVNGDGKVNVKDATMIQKAAAKITKLTDDERLRADVNADSKVNVKDATAIQKFAAKIETGFPIGKDISA